jgi:flagellar hook-length control protein FliK
VTASDAGSFRDVLCTKVVRRNQASATASKTNGDDGGFRVESGLKAGEKTGNQGTSAVKLRGPAEQDTKHSLGTTSALAPAPLQLWIAPSAAKTSAATTRNLLTQTGLGLSDIVGVIPSNTSGATLTSAPTQLASAPPVASPDQAVNSPASAAMPCPQVANQPQSHFQSEAAAGQDIPSPAGDQAPPMGSPQPGGPDLGLFSFPGAAAAGDTPSLPDGLANPPGAPQKADKSNLPPLPSSTTMSDRHDLPVENQPANNNDANSGNAVVSVTAAPAAPPLQAATMANTFLGTTPCAASAPQSLSPNRKMNSGEPARTDRKEDRNSARTSQAGTDTQPESQTVPLRAGDPATRTEEISPAAAVMGHNPNPDRTSVATTPSGLDGPQASHASPDNPLVPGVKRQSTPLAPTSTAGDTPSTAPPVLQSARVLERMGQSEIRVGLNTANFGTLELHASVNQDRVAATLATSHSELRAALAAEMPSLEHGMAKHQLTLDSFHFDTRSGAQDKNHGASGGQQNRSYPQTEAAEPGAAGDSLAAPETIMPPQFWTGPYSSGLNVHA